MKIHSLTINNFLAIGDAHLLLSDRGLVLVQGVNSDETSAISNGSGKSSIADALSWCLFGRTARGEEGDKVVNRFVGKDCKVKVEIFDGSDHYCVIRYRKHKTHKNALQVVHFNPDGVSTELTKGTEKLTQEIVDRVIGCSWDVFCGAVYAGQERMPDLPGMTDKQLKLLIEEASGATVLEAAYREALNRLGIRKTDLAYRDGAVLDFARHLDQARESLAEAEKGKLGFEELRMKSVRIAATQAQEAKRQVDRLSLELKELITKFGTSEALEKQMAAIDASIAAIGEEQKKLARLEGEVRTATTGLTIATRDLDELAKRLKLAIQELADLDHQVGCPCDTCARPYTADDIAPAKGLASKKITDLRDATRYMKNIKDIAHKSICEATERRNAFAASMTDTSESIAVRTRLQGELRFIEMNQAAMRGHQSDLDIFNRQIIERRDDPNPYIPQIANAISRITDCETMVTKTEGDRAAAEQLVKIAESSSKVFSPAGVRAFLLDEITPFLNDQTAKYLGTLSDGNITATWSTLVKTAKGELKEKFSIEVVNAKGGETFGLISGGEKRKVRIACALALQDLVARRASKPIELFIGDEVDDALDSAGLERLTMILEEKARERGSVFIISHNSLRDWVSQIIVVKRVGGRSFIEETVA